MSRTRTKKERTGMHQIARAALVAFTLAIIPAGAQRPVPPPADNSDSAADTGLVVIQLDNVVNRSGNNPFDAQNPTGSSGCATNFSPGSYRCGGACGISSAILTVTSGSNTMTANPFGSNSNAGFNCSGAGATSQGSNLTILGAPNYSCTLSASTLNAFGVSCRNPSGGTCSSSCSR